MGRWVAGCFTWSLIVGCTLKPDGKASSPYCFPWWHRWKLKWHACGVINRWLEDKKHRKCFIPFSLHLKGNSDESMAEYEADIRNQHFGHISPGWSGYLSSPGPISSYNGSPKRA